MKVKENVAFLYEKANEKFASQFGFYVKDVNVNNIVDYMHQPKDSSSLAVTRILFGLAMLFDIPDERGGANMEKRWGNHRTCHFPLLPFIKAMPLPYMAIVYAGLWCGAVGIMLGYKYRISSTTFTVCYWYMLLIEKSYWNNHSYLFGLVALLLTFTEANCYWSLDVYLDPSKLKKTVPYWNYFVLKYQFFILYFTAGLKKGTAEWLTGYSVKNLSEHWVFEPFKLFLSVSQTDYLIVHWFVFVFDLTVAMWMMYSRTRNIAVFFCVLFHLMNSRLFSIGMFPWVCLATLPLFYRFDWPKIILQKIRHFTADVHTELIKIINGFLLDKKCDCDVVSEINNEYLQTDNISPGTLKHTEPINETNAENVEDHSFDDSKKEKAKDTPDISKNINSNNGGKKLTLYLIVLHIVTQLFLPYSHFITKGFNNWTNGLYGYSWDMMVHTWDNYAVIIKVVDNDKDREFYVDPNIFSPNNRWTRHGDMVYQYARCLKENLINEAKEAKQSHTTFANFSIYIDVWCSLNGRFMQRMFDPNVDMLKAEWSPFRKVPYLMPLLDEALSWRENLNKITQEVQGWTNYTDVVYLAEFPGYKQDNFISAELENVTITVLKGDVVFEAEVTKSQTGHSYKLSDGDHIVVETEIFHSVKNIGGTPAYYMYTFNNITQKNTNDNALVQPKLPIGLELYKRFNKTIIFGNLMLKHLGNVVFSLLTC